MPVAGDGLTFDLRLSEGKADPAEDQQLQKEKDVPPEFLERRVGLQVLDRLLPEKCR